MTEREAAPAESMAEIMKRIEELEGLIDDAVTAFVRRSQKEREERRQAILAGRPPGGDRIRFSYNIVTYDYHNGSYRLGWGKLIYRGEMDKDGKRKKSARRIPGNSKITELPKVVAGAYPEEVELLKSHEYQCRVYRRLFRDFQDARAKLKILAGTANKAAGLQDDPMVARA